MRVPAYVFAVMRLLHSLCRRQLRLLSLSGIGDVSVKPVLPGVSQVDERDPHPRTFFGVRQQRSRTVLHRRYPRRLPFVIITPDVHPIDRVRLPPPSPLGQITWRHRRPPTA
jgi:hypothetical protein